MLFRACGKRIPVTGGYSEYPDRKEDDEITASWSTYRCCVGKAETRPRQHRQRKESHGGGEGVSSFGAHQRADAVPDPARGEDALRVRGGRGERADDLHRRVGAPVAVHGGGDNVELVPELPDPVVVVRVVACNTKGYSSTYLAMGFANVRAGTR